MKKMNHKIYFFGKSKYWIILFYSFRVDPCDLCDIYFFFVRFWVLLVFFEFHDWLQILFNKFHLVDNFFLKIKKLSIFFEHCVLDHRLKCFLKQSLQIVNSVIQSVNWSFLGGFITFFSFFAFHLSFFFGNLVQNVNSIILLAWIAALKVGHYIIEHVANNAQHCINICLLRFENVFKNKYGYHLTVLSKLNRRNAIYFIFF